MDTLLEDFIERWMTRLWRKGRGFEGNYGVGERSIIVIVTVSGVGNGGANEEEGLDGKLGMEVER